jgi:4-nitrophenyl phosphatase
MLADRYDALLLDLDGVLFRGAETVPGGPETLTTLRASGRRIAFVTNNSARTPEQVADTLGGHGYEAHPDEVVTSALATADLLAERGATEAYVIGEEGIRRALTDAGVQVMDGEPATAGYVVVGWDREATYAKLRTASCSWSGGRGSSPRTPMRPTPRRTASGPGPGLCSR